MSRDAHGMPPIGTMTPEHVEAVRRMSAAIVVELFGHPGGSGVKEGEPGQLAGAGGALGPAAVPLGPFQESLRLSVGRLLADIVRISDGHRSPLSGNPLSSLMWARRQASLQQKESMTHSSTRLVPRLSPAKTSKLEAAASHMTPLRVGLYAAHDTTVLPLLLALVPPRQGATNSNPTSVR